MTEKRLGPEDPGPLQDVDADVPVDEDVIDIGRNEGPELTTDVDDVDAGSSGGRRDAGVEPPD
ncbi:MAG: hypothetical protein ACTHJL_12550 [Amnibacterium sp.]